MSSSQTQKSSYLPRYLIAEGSSSKPQASHKTEIQYPTPKDALLLVSSQGFMYLVYKNAESFLWQHQLNTTVYRAHHENTLDYVDAQTDENGKVKLYQYSQGSKTKIDLGNIVSTSFVEEFYLDWKTGHRHDNSPMKLRINRRAYLLSENSQTSIWTLNFSIYKATYIEGDTACPCRVHHTFGNEDFIKFCQDRMNYAFSRGVLKGMNASDISIGSKIEAGKITLDDPPLNIWGSKKIFYGAYQGMRAAVKRSSLSVGISTIYDSIVKSQRHDNISRFFGGERCENGDFLMAFELYYNDFDTSCETLTFNELTVVIRGVISGLIHLHKLGLSFGNINPKKVMMSDQRVPKLCGIGNCETLTEELIDNDFRGLGKFTAYTFCRKAGQLPEVSTEDTYHELSNEVLLKHLNDANEIEAHNIAAFLINHGRYPVKSILCRPFLWAASVKLGFFRDVSDFLKSHGASKPNGKKDKTHNLYIIEGTMKFTAIADGVDGWKNRFPATLVTHMQHPPAEYGLSVTVYQPFFVLDLRFLRNLIAHREEIYRRLGDADAKFLGNEEDLIKYIRENFPPLLTRVYNELEQSHIAKRKLAKYFQPN